MKREKKKTNAPRKKKKKFNPLGCDDDWSTSQASTHAQARSNEAA